MAAQVISARHSIILPYRKADALAVIQRIESVEKIEGAAVRVTAHHEKARYGTHDVGGRFAGIPWRSRYWHERDGDGFRGEQMHAPPLGKRISGGFQVEAIGKHACKVSYSEEYLLPRWLVPFRPAIEGYLNWSVIKELRDLRALIAGRTAPSPR
ncbi:MAG: hypothetical protein OJF49_004519 [Ktedonobacterales bacterium]|jgi:hypothetical protein|nr:MAG: hypothetical protein OJF49_004519 [Ktedonobacterales bacterium]